MKRQKHDIDWSDLADMAHFAELPEDYWARDLVAVHGMLLKALARHAKGRG